MLEILKAWGWNLVIPFYYTGIGLQMLFGAFREKEEPKEIPIPETPYFYMGLADDEADKERRNKAITKKAELRKVVNAKKAKEQSYIDEVLRELRKEYEYENRYGRGYGRYHKSYDYFDIYKSEFDAKTDEVVCYYRGSDSYTTRHKVNSKELLEKRIKDARKVLREGKTVREREQASKDITKYEQKLRAIEREEKAKRDSERSYRNRY